jgi:hypothetical protein
MDGGKREIAFVDLREGMWKKGMGGMVEARPTIQAGTQGGKPHDVQK